MISVDEYKRVLKDWPIPASIIATKERTDSQHWRDGDKRRLEHHCWLIATADPELKRVNVEHQVSFDSAIAAPRIDLAHPDYRSANLGKKLLVLRSLTQGIGGKAELSSGLIAHFAQLWTWLLRFALSKGYKSFAEFTIDDFHESCEIMSTGEILDLVPYEELLFDLMLSGDMESLIEKDRIKWTNVAQWLGVTSASITRSSGFADALVGTFPEIFTNRPKLLLQLRTGTRLGNYAPDKPERLDGTETAETNDRDIVDTDADGALAGEIATPKRRKFQSYFEVWDYLFSVGKNRPGEEGLSFNPFELDSKKQLCVRYSDSGIGRTLTVQPTDLFRVLDVATKWVYHYGDFIADAYSVLQGKLSSEERRRLEREWAAVRPAGAPKFTAGMSGGRVRGTPNPSWITAGDAVKYLIAAAAVIVLFFGARRSIEGNSLKIGCLIQERPGLLELEVYIAKTHRELGRRPVPELVRRAVQILEKLSAPTRSVTGKDWLFAVARHVRSPGRLVSTRFDIIIDQFVTFSGLEPPEGQAAWGLTSHVFRRGFGIFYYHGFEGANLDALSLMYWHYNPRMTRIYVNLALPGKINQLRQAIQRSQQSAKVNRTLEEKLWLKNAREDLRALKAFANDFDEARCEFFVSKMIDIWMRKETVAGKGGRALFNNIQAIAARAATAIRIGSRANSSEISVEELIGDFQKFAAVNFLEPVIGTNVFCTADPNDESVASEANCLGIKRKLLSPGRLTEEVSPSLPDHDFALNRVCVGCPFCAIFSKGREAIRKELKDETRRVSLLGTPALKEEARRRAREYRQAYLSALDPERAKR